jgi:hypothetical protein
LDRIGEIVIPALIRMEERLNAVATQAQLESLHGELLVEIGRRPTRLDAWVIGIALFTLVVMAFAAGAIWLPYIAKYLGAA